MAGGGSVLSRAEAVQSRTEGALNGNSFRTLEFEAVRSFVLAHAGSAEGKLRIRNLAPAIDLATVRDALALTSEAAALLRGVGRQPYHDLPDVGEVLQSARVAGWHLEPAELTSIASFIQGAVEVGRTVARAEGALRLAALASEVRDTSDVAAAIRRAILPSGEVADDASPRLLETRRTLARLKTQLHSVMESFLRGKDAERLLQDKLVTTRNDRYVILLKAEHRGQVPGIIHGSSGSGASLFVEPLPAVELNNDIVALGDEERREVIRILTALTARVGERAFDLQRTVEIMGELDALQAKALSAAAMRAVAPSLSDGLDLELREARHPLLMPTVSERIGLSRRTTREPVPVTLRVGFGSPVLVISGPNTGGKTVALKTVGLLALMAQCGLHIPVAEGSTLPVFRRVFADIGDEQSIGADLSTFSAHLATIVEMTRDLEHPSLVLLDEVGAGTDPTEGGALGVAVVEHFRERGAMVVATTHHGLMKSYAQSTPAVACGSFGYHPETYEPNYQLTLGRAGRSLALEMAERLGLPAPVVSDARGRLDDKQAQAEALLKKLEEHEAALRLEGDRIAESRRALREEQQRLRETERRIEATKKSQAEAFARELQRRGEEAARRMADAVRQAVQRVEAVRTTQSARAVQNAAARSRTEAVRDIREAQQEAIRDLAPAALEENEREPALALAAGARVRLRTLGVAGEVLSLGAHGDAEVAVAGKRLRVPTGELVPVPGGRSARTNDRHLQAAASVLSSGAPAPMEINVVGQTVDEALPRVDKLLDQAALADRHQVRVIHGFGQGTLRKAVAGLLDGHPHVATFRAGGPGEGGGGVTVVELKD
jgi:DNA mismatch repair protein MutS2